MKHRFTADAAEDLAYWKKHDARKVERIKLLLEDIKANHPKGIATSSKIGIVVAQDRSGTPFGLFGRRRYGNGLCLPIPLRTLKQFVDFEAV